MQDVLILCCKFVQPILKLGEASVSYRVSKLSSLFCLELPDVIPKCNYGRFFWCDSKLKTGSLQLGKLIVRQLQLKMVTHGRERFTESRNWQAPGTKPLSRRRSA
jgi:hypothetical protein